jgi:hypothetical protein
VVVRSTDVIRTRVKYTVVCQQMQCPTVAAGRVRARRTDRAQLAMGPRWRFGLGLGPSLALRARIGNDRCGARWLTVRKPMLQRLTGRRPMLPGFVRRSRPAAEIAYRASGGEDGRRKPYNLSRHGTSTRRSELRTVPLPIRSEGGSASRRIRPPAAATAYSDRGPGGAAGRRRLGALLPASSAERDATWRSLPRPRSLRFLRLHRDAVRTVRSDISDGVSGVQADGVPTVVAMSGLRC